MNNLLARDARALRKYISDIQPDVKLVYENEKPNGEVTEIAIPIGVGFFWPDAGV